MSKSILSKIIVAKKQNKKIVKVKHKKYYNKLLDLLWNEGFIFGYQIKIYVKIFYGYRIFLKHSNKNYCLLKRLIYFNKSIKNKTLTNLNIIEKNYVFFLINDKGFFSQKKSLFLNCGGFLFVKL